MTAPFMPVAFWNQAIYEREWAFEAERGSFAGYLSGFSKWTAKHGLMQTADADPVWGFHFSLSADEPKREQGLLSIPFSTDIGCFDVTRNFEKLLQGQRVSFCPRRDTTEPYDPRRHELPVVSFKPELDRSERKIIDAVFSFLFYSNFKHSPSTDWSTLLRNIGVHERRAFPPKSLGELAGNLFQEYRELIRADQRILTFEHYYVFLLNPSLDFRVRGDRALRSPYSALGTLNLYSHFPLPAVLLASVRKHLESIYHFHRELEDWEDATESAFQRVRDAMGHELSTVQTGGVSAAEYAESKPTRDQREALAIKMMKSALIYGQLWSGSNDFHEIDATCGDEFFAQASSLAWRTFLGVHVVETSIQDLRDDDVETLNMLWATPQCRGLFDIRVGDVSADFDQASFRGALARWILAAMVNALRHRLIPHEAKYGHAERVEQARGAVENQRPLLRVRVEGGEDSLLVCILNDYHQKAGTAARQGEAGKKTRLALDIAAEQILSVLFEIRDRRDRWCDVFFLGGPADSAVANVLKALFGRVELGGASAVWLTALRVRGRGQSATAISVSS